MATKTITTTKLIDDIDGADAAETIVFSVEGKNYEIDLSEENARNLRIAFERYVSAARKVGKPSAPKATRTSRDVSPTAVRAWAASNGVSVSPRGRIKAEVIEQFRAAGN